MLSTLLVGCSGSEERWAASWGSRSRKLQRGSSGFRHFQLVVSCLMPKTIHR
jgi:hypothetical protein